MRHPRPVSRPSGAEGRYGDPYAPPAPVSRPSGAEGRYGDPMRPACASRPVSGG